MHALLSPGIEASTDEPPIAVFTARMAINRRTRELAAQAGRIAPHVNQSDYEQAKREISGEREGPRQDAVLDALDRC